MPIDAGISPRIGLSHRRTPRRWEQLPVQPSKHGRAFDRGREDYADRVFINPYTSPGLRKRWDDGFRAAAQERRQSVRRSAPQQPIDRGVR